MNNHLPRVLLVCLSLPLAACGAAENKEMKIASFDGAALPQGVSGPGSKLTVLPDGQGLEVVFDAQSKFSGVQFDADGFWDFSGLGDCSLALDVRNTGAYSVHLYATVSDASGSGAVRSINIPAGCDQTFYFLLQGELGGDDNGMRGGPSPFYKTEQSFIWMWGNKDLDLKKIARIRFGVDTIPNDKQLVIEGLRAVANPERDPKYIVGLMDEFGQNARVDFPGKAQSEAELKRLADAELKALAQSGPMADRSKFGGWAKGPKLRGTGFFRTEKVGGKWALVDPEGFLYFATGIDNSRMANTTTTTGIDFSDSSIRKFAAGEVTPEDSIGMVRTPDAVRKTRYVASELRRDLFTWLPPYDHPLANHYSYSRSVHQGPVKHGETYSFYQANLERRYGETRPGSYLEKWKDVTIDRMLDWGFTSMGNWTDPMFYGNEKIPFFANGWIIGDFKTVTSGDDFWSPLPDPFDPEFAKRANITAQTIAKEVAETPWCVGVFIDNEKSWGRSESDRARFGIAINTLKRADSDSPTKAVFTRMLKERYSTIQALNTSWKTSIESWDSLSQGVALADLNEGVKSDLSRLLKAYASEYFTIVKRTLKDVMPNHLYLGARLAHWGMPPEVVQAAAEQVDVMSYNSYKEFLHPKSWEFLAEIDMPSIIGEYHIGALDTGLYHPGLIMASDQQDRARMYGLYLDSVIDNPYFVGAHWFQYIDSPLTGRAYDGENYNVGFVSVADIPYKEMVDESKRQHQTLYERRFGGLND